MGFKQCPGCQRWFTLAEIMDAPEVVPIGMQLVDESEAGFYFFNHLVDGCGSTFTVPFEELTPVMEGSSPRRGPDEVAECGGFCRRLEDLRACGHDCSHAPYRRFLLDVLLPRRRRLKVLGFGGE